ncbi:MAG: adenylyl-sulfate kinase [Gammaproteobacteria bacterium]|nr:adenylyl-sulfate kinase [Gammaproteobacteria bacterium]
MPSTLISPHGGRLVDLFAKGPDLDAAKLAAKDYPSWDLSARQLCDIELLMTGAFSPLEGFLDEANYNQVLANGALVNGIAWPIPITLAVDEAFADVLSLGDHIALRDPEGVLVAVLKLKSQWRPDRLAEAQALYGSTDEAHPEVNHLLNQTGAVYLGGDILGLELPPHYDHRALRHTPSAMRARLANIGAQRIIAAYTDDPLHQRDVAALQAVSEGKHLLLHAGGGHVASQTYNRFTRIRCYTSVLRHWEAQHVTLAMLNLAPRAAHDRDVVLQAIIEQNFGANELAVADANVDAAGVDITLTPLPDLAYNVADRAFRLRDDTTEAYPAGAQLHEMLTGNAQAPSWLSYPEVLTQLRQEWPARTQQGFTVFFTGLSGSGKSTIANALVVQLMERGGRKVTLLDGDLVRKHLSSELGFSKEHRNINIERIGYVASEITKHGGIAVCAPIAPYATTRLSVRQMVETHGGFIETYVATPLEVCEARDRKGLYAMARAGKIKEFTGIDDPYDVPEQPELVLDTQTLSPDAAAAYVVEQLTVWGYLPPA